MVAPGLELMVREDATDGFRRDGLDEALSLQLACELVAVPLREGAAAEIRALAGQLDQMHSHCGGKTPAVDPGRVGRTSLECAA